MAARGEDGDEADGSGRSSGPFNQDHAQWSNIAFHLAPCSSWEEARRTGALRPERFAEEGFVHLTRGLGQLLVPANAYHAGDPRPHVALSVDLDAVGCEVRFDADPPLYPHAYGPLPLTAIREVRAALRDEGGTFVGWGPPEPV